MNKKLYVSILSSIFIPFAFSHNVTKIQNETTETDQLNQATIETERFCIQLESCESICNSGEELDDLNLLKTMPCSCDGRCSTYGDCCIRQNEKFACTRTVYNGYLYMVHKCPTNYTSLEIIRNCETTDEIDLLHNLLLSVPVTNEMKNITYRNIFCAFCHLEWQFEFWNTMMSCRLMNGKNVEIIPDGFPIQHLQTVISTALLLSNLKVDENRKILISKIGVSPYKCEINAKLPDNLTSYAHSCNPNTANSTYFELSMKRTLLLESLFANTSLRSTFQVHLNDTFLLQINDCNHIPSNSTIRKIVCPSGETPLPVNDIEQDAEFCFYKTSDGRRCLINRFLTKDVDFQYIDEDTIFVKSFKTKFSIAEWIAGTDNNTIFLCGTEIPHSDDKKFNMKMNDMIRGILIKISIVFLTAHLINLMISANHKKLQSLPNKVMYSYSAVLLAIYVLWEMQSWQTTCMVSSIVMHYLCLCCFTWLLIASYDCWLIVCHSSEKFLTVAGKARLKRYLFYCFWGWISPLSIVGVAIYFEFAPNTTIPCSLKPGYGRLNQCFLAQETPLNYFYQYPTMVVTCLNVTLFMHTSYRIFLSKRDGITSTGQNNSYVIFVKLAFNMGVVALMVLVWAFYILVTNIDIVVFHTMKEIVEASQGIFIFFAFSFDKSMIKRCRCK